MSGDVVNKNLRVVELASVCDGLLATPASVCDGLLATPAITLRSRQHFSVNGETNRRGSIALIILGKHL
ncbi:hypothetical protein [Rhizobium sp. BE258]|uniref:hypothetical protein n=1 Tax=Rhizobium sp. BE258 TaxID=2817722 RepID=UPI00285E7610|nr:hypothetical protein [Rhizobium sp. BE258]MDR7143642.1 hypothetical protein [Rhizobium sp. BE258]